MAITILEKNSKDLITKAVLTEGELPTDTDTYAWNCFIYKWEDPYYFLYVNQTSDTTQEPSWKNEGNYDYNIPVPQANSVTESTIQDDAVTQDKLNYSVHVVTIAPMATSGESIADPLIAGGQILGFYPAGNQDQFVTNVEITEDFKAKITLGSAATAPNIFNVVILKT